MKHLTTLTGILLLLVLSLSACGAADTPDTAANPSASAAPSPSPSSVPIPSTNAAPTTTTVAPTLLSMKLSGGFCQYGQCWAVREIAEDGSYVVADGTGAQNSGTLDPTLLTELKAQIEQADFAEIKAQPFTGTCPIAYDGQEVTYTFHTAQGEHTFSNCEVGIDETSPLFQTIEQALTLMTQQ